MEKYKIALHCAYHEFWRYNLYITGKVFSGDECVDIIDHRDIAARVGSELKCIPIGYKRKRATTIDTAEGDSLILYIYVVTNTLPMTNAIADARPFKCKVTIYDGDKVLYEQYHNIDQWSGNNIAIEL